MKTKEILVIGAGIAGCAVALALAKRGLSVTIMTSPFDRRVYHSAFLPHDSLEEKVRDLKKERQENQSCSRAFDQLALLARQSIEELLESNYLVDRHGNIDIHRSLLDQLNQNPQVEWYSHHSVIELLTLEQHSQRKSDRYKKPACLGAIAYDHENQKIEYFFAKETILATGGATSLYPYSTHTSSACGGGIAIAHRAGARLLNMDQIQFYPLGLFQKDESCFPIPLELLSTGAKVYISKATPLEIDLVSPNYLLHQLYGQLLKTKSEHLWLDLTILDPLELKEKFPAMDTYCLNHGFNFVKDLLPVVPVAAYTCGGIAVDKFAQTSLSRLRAIGEVSCTGLFWNYKEESIGVLESLTWAIACAEDVLKQLSKFVYYFPELKEGSYHLAVPSNILEEDWKLLRQIMWHYVGIYHDRSHLERGCALLNQLALLNTPHDFASTSIEQLQLHSAIQTAQLIAHSLRSQQGTLSHIFS